MKRMTLWHPTDKGVIVEVDVAWPRSLWTRDAVQGLPRSTATIREVAAAAVDRRDETERERTARAEAIMASAPPDEAPLIEHSRFLKALSDTWKFGEGGTFQVSTREHNAYMAGVRRAQRARDREGR